MNWPAFLGMSAAIIFFISGFVAIDYMSGDRRPSQRNILIALLAYITIAASVAVGLGVQ